MSGMSLEVVIARMSQINETWSTGTAEGLKNRKWYREKMGTDRFRELLRYLKNFEEGTCPVRPWKHGNFETTFDVARCFRIDGVYKKLEVEGIPVVYGLNIISDNVKFAREREQLKEYSSTISADELAKIEVEVLVNAKSESESRKAATVKG